MRLQFFIIADYANVTADGKLNALGIFREINAANFPARCASLYLAAMFAGESGEYGQSHELFVQLFDADGVEIISRSRQVTFPTPSAGRPPTGHFILELTELVFPAPGPYMLYLFQKDREPFGAIPIYLNQIDAS